MTSILSNGNGRMVFATLRPERRPADVELEPFPGAAVNVTPCRTSCVGAWSSTATSSSEASDTSPAVG